MFFLYPNSWKGDDFIKLEDENYEKKYQSILEEHKKIDEEYNQKIKELGIKLYQKKEINISDKDLNNIRKKVEKAFLKTKKEDFKSLGEHFEINEFMGYWDEDYEYIGKLIHNKDEYNKALKEDQEDGYTERDLKKYINDEKKHYYEFKILQTRFKEKLSWKDVAKETGLSIRQCQRIKDDFLNKLIISWLENEKEIFKDRWFWGYWD